MWLVKRVHFRRGGQRHVAELKDINGREFLVLGVFAVAVLLMGVWPEPLTHLMDNSVNQLVQVLAIHKV